MKSCSGSVKECDYRQFRLEKLSAPEFRHLWLLLFWPLFGIAFGLLERLPDAGRFRAVHCALDDVIPFCEWFLIPYLFWFVYLTGAVAYTLFFDVSVFRRLMRFIIFTYTVTLVIYILFPSCQELRPIIFERDNMLTRLTALFYRFDTNTNVCPSIHVIGSFAAMFAFLRTRRLRRPLLRVLNVVIALLICLSTVFMKQHSALDVLAALPLCAAGYILFFSGSAR